GDPRQRKDADHPVDRARGGAAHLLLERAIVALLPVVVGVREGRRGGRGRVERAQVGSGGGFLARGCGRRRGRFRGRLLRGGGRLGFRLGGLGRGVGRAGIARQILGRLGNLRLEIG